MCAIAFGIYLNSKNLINFNFQHFNQFFFHFFLVFSIITLVMFKFLAGVIVWIVLIGAVLAFVAATALLWYNHKINFH